MSDDYGSTSSGLGQGESDGGQPTLVIRELVSSITFLLQVFLFLFLDSRVDFLLELHEAHVSIEGSISPLIDGPRPR